MYDHRTGKDRILSKLKTMMNIEKDHEWLTDHNEIISTDKSLSTFISVISVRLKRSEELFQMKEKEKLSKIIKVFFSEIVQILGESDTKREINIVDDTIYAIYATPTKDDVYNVARVAFSINTFMGMINKLFENENLPKIAAGIGMGTSYDTLVEVKQKGTGFNKVVPLGNALHDALKLSNTSNPNESEKRIGFNEIAYNNFIDQLVSEDENAKSWFVNLENNYYANIIYTDFQEYIKLL